MTDSKDEERCRSPWTKPVEYDERDSLKVPRVNWRQIAGCLSANSIALAAGFSMSYTSALFPALLSPDSDIPTTPEDCAWIASSGSLSAPVGALLGGYLMEHFGRVTTIQVTMLPYCIAWIVTATAQNLTALIIGRVLIGAVYNTAITAAGVLIAEVALKDYRGAFSSAAFATHAFGVLCGYTFGAFLDWRTLAWVSMLAPIISFILVCAFTAESPLWLRLRGRVKKAQKVSLYYYDEPNYVVQPVPQETLHSNTNDGTVHGTIRPNFTKQLGNLLTRPSGFKPLIILNILFMFQHLSGFVIILMYGVSFLKEAGITINPYYATILIGVARFIASLVTVFLIRRYKRRTLMLLSTVGMAMTMAASAYTTMSRQSGSTSALPSWFSVACIVVYHLAATVGLQTIPYTMASELFPQQVRGAAQAVNMVTSELFMFIGLLAYPWMNTNMGGAVGVQYFFASASIVAAIFTWIYCPETHAKTLAEIEEYFAKNTMFLGLKK